MAESSPKELPQVLSDPLREFRLLIFLLALGQLVWMWRIADTADPVVAFTTYDALAVFFACVMNGLGWTLFVILPWRAPNALFLRSFRTDPDTNRMRGHIQSALGFRYRLSGIRDPRKRLSQIARFFLTAIFLVRYCIPKYMNLEAGHDWKLRLMSSFDETRCVIIDVRDVGPYVEQEIKLSVTCLTPQRVLFIATDAQAPEEVRHMIRGILKSDDIDDAQIQIANWQDNPAGRKRFRQQVRSFRDALPAGLVEVDEELFADESLAGDETGDSTNYREVWALIAIIAVIVITAFTGHLLLLNSVLQLLVAVWFALEMARYFIECGSVFERVRLCLTLSAGTAFSHWVFYSARPF
jgi:hypothetical protein